MSHFILILASFPLILVFYSLFNHYYSTQEHSLEIFRVPTAPGKPGKMTTVFPVLEKYWNFIILLKILEKWE